MIKPLFEKIIVAVNGSEQSLRAAMYGIMMSKMYKCEMKVVYVVDTDTLKQLELMKFFVTEESNRYEQNLVADGERYLSYVSDLAKQKSVKIQTELKKGAVWSELIRESKDFGADLILIGGRQSGGNSSLRHDKTSAINSEIIGSADCNVLVVKEPEIEKLFKLA